MTVLEESDILLVLSALVVLADLFLIPPVRQLPLQWTPASKTHNNEKGGTNISFFLFFRLFILTRYIHAVLRQFCLPFLQQQQQQQQKRHTKTLTTPSSH
jgi:hypothetical protein